MNIYVHGTGAREHAIIDTLQQDERVGAIFSDHVIPKTIHVLYKDYHDLIIKLKNNNIEFAIIGPEQPLADGLVDLMKKYDVPCFGPVKSHARLETSKFYAKQMMEKHNIKTAKYKYFRQASSAHEYVDMLLSRSYVIKKDGLAAGKGVAIPPTREQAHKVISEFRTDILIEEKLYGEEVSVIAFCNGHQAFLMPQVQDYKRTHNGLNTGGMGAYSPANILTEQEIAEVQIWLDRLVADLKYVGFLYAGIMKTINGLYVLEFNCRLGDPEAQVLMNLLDSSLITILIACYFGSLPDIQWKSGYCTTVVLSHIDYPLKKLETPTIIAGLDKLDQDIKVYYSNIHNSTTTGGRIASITNYSNTLFDSFSKVYNNIRRIELEDKKRYYRDDIGLNALLAKKSYKTIKVAILGSTNGTSAKRLLEFAQSNDYVSIELIVSDRPMAGILNLAKQNNIAHLYRPKKLNESRAEYDEFICNILKLYEIDYVFLIGYMRIISDIFLQTFHNRVFNIHPSLLPRFAGGMDMSVHEAVLQSGEYVSGCTLHLVSKEVDAGKMILQKSLVINTDNPAELKRQIQELESQAIVECVKLIINGTIDDKITYEMSGVSITRGENVVESLTSKIDNLNRFCSIRNGLAMTTDGVGTKIELCSKHDQLHAAGIDLVAMSVNDLICHGAVPEYFLDYIATDRISHNVDEFIKGVLDGCEQAGCQLIGGETAEMKSLYRVNTMDAAGFAVGRVVYPISGDVNDGDILVGLKSSGLHSNGFSLIREVYKNQSMVDWEKMLMPTTIYVNQIKEILENDKIRVKAIVHITGGGWIKNISRALKDNQSFTIDYCDWKNDLLFQDIQNKTKLSDFEMLETFNCGIGMILIIAPESVIDDSLIRVGTVINDS